MGCLLGASIITEKKIFLFCEHCSSCFLRTIDYWSSLVVCINENQSSVSDSFTTYKRTGLFSYSFKQSSCEREIPWSDYCERRNSVLSIGKQCNSVSFYMELFKKLHSLFVTHSVYTHICTGRHTAYSIYRIWFCSSPSGSVVHNGVTIEIIHFQTETVSNGFVQEKAEVVLTSSDNNIERFNFIRILHKNGKQMNTVSAYSTLLKEKIYWVDSEIEALCSFNRYA